MANDITAPTMPKRPPARQPNHDPRVLSFLNDYTALVDQAQALTENLDDRKRQIEQLEDRVDLLSRELVTVQNDRDRYQRGYHDLRAQLTVLATAAVGACQSVINTANAAMESAENEINGGGRKPAEPAPEPKLPPVADLEAEIAKLATSTEL